MALSVAIRERWQKQALPTATPNSARYFILIASLSMLANQCLEHAREPRRKPCGPDALSRDAGTLAYQEDLVSETLGISQLGVATKADQLFTCRGFIHTRE
jgi:hypothetical protein